jgi:hypothetical protein
MDLCLVAVALQQDNTQKHISQKIAPLKRISTQTMKDITANEYSGEKRKEK